MSDQIVLRSGNSTASIKKTGAELVEWNVEGVNLLHTGQIPQWKQTCPIMFPACGRSFRSSALFDGLKFPMPLHGFVNRMKFRLLSWDGAAATLEASSDEVTLQMFPFNFRLRLSVELEIDTIRLKFSVVNCSDRKLPYSVGFHPSFQWPIGASDKYDWRLEFSQQESQLVPCVSSDGFIQRKLRSVNLRNRRLALRDELFENEALCFLNAKSKELVLSGGAASILISAPDARHWTIWSVPGQQFITVEPCTGHADFEGEEVPFIQRVGGSEIDVGGENTFSVTFKFSIF